MADNCCALCKGPHGICLSRHRCNHHLEAQAQDDANHRASRTIRDPTGDAAIANITRERRGQRAPAPGPFPYLNSRSKQ